MFYREPYRSEELESYLERLSPIDTFKFYGKEKSKPIHISTGWYRGLRDRAIEDSQKIMEDWSLPSLITDEYLRHLTEKEKENMINNGYDYKKFRTSLNDMYMVFDGKGYPARRATIDEFHGVINAEFDMGPLVDGMKVSCPGPGCLDIYKVTFNGTKTIVEWKDGTKTLVNCNGEFFDPEKGLAMAIVKKAFGNKGNYYNTFNKALENARYYNMPEDNWDAFFQALNVYYATHKMEEKKDE